MINKNKYHLLCFLLINSMFQLEKQAWGWAYLFKIQITSFIYFFTINHLLKNIYWTCTRIGNVLETRYGLICRIAKIKATIHQKKVKMHDWYVLLKQRLKIILWKLWEIIRKNSSPKWHNCPKIEGCKTEIIQYFVVTHGS
jgi:hypothetical protein